VTLNHQEGRVLAAGLVPAAPARHWGGTGCHLLRAHEVRVVVVELTVNACYIPGPCSAGAPNSGSGITERGAIEGDEVKGELEGDKGNLTTES